MKSRRVAWLNEDEHQNLLKYDLSFNAAKGVIENSLTLKISNVDGDYSYIGFDNEMRSVLYVYAAKEDGLARILFARRATSKEKEVFYKHLEELL